MEFTNRKALLVLCLLVLNCRATLSADVESVIESQCDENENCLSMEELAEVNKLVHLIHQTVHYNPNLQVLLGAISLEADLHTFFYQYKGQKVPDVIFEIAERLYRDENREVNMKKYRVGDLTHLVTTVVNYLGVSRDAEERPINSSTSVDELEEDLQKNTKTTQERIEPKTPKGVGFYVGASMVGVIAAFGLLTISMQLFNALRALIAYTKTSSAATTN